MKRTLVRLASVALVVGAAPFVAASPALAGTGCSPTPYICGTVQNSSAHPVMIGDWCGENPGSMCNFKVLMPGEHSQKYMPDTDAFQLICDGVANWGYAIPENHRAFQVIRIKNWNSIDVRYQNC
jgi:hypothetical protein